MICCLANILWLTACLPELTRFRRATMRLREEQERLLGALLRANADTEFGRVHSFGAIRSVREYQQRVPPRTYDEYHPWIERVARGNPNVLTRQRVRLLEPTSGSTGRRKLIPYTLALQGEFNRAIRPWVGNLFLNRPDLLRGQAYWSVSPLTAAACQTEGGIPIGFEDDSAYLGYWQQRLMRAVIAVPASVRHIADIEAFRYQTLLSLVSCANLRLVSVWNPTFLSLLIDQLPAVGARLARDLRDTARRTVLERALKANTPGECHATLWPRLALISCWADGNAAEPAAQLARAFPHAQIQSKGLIATEAFISFPMLGHDAAVLAVRSHFLEFVPVDSDDEVRDESPRLAHELDKGQRYEVVVSTGGGLYRYHLHDIIEVVGSLNQCPSIRFVGRHRRMSDWFGEKLHETYVDRTLRDAFAATGVSPSFAMLACDRSLPVPAYVLYVETPALDLTLSVLGRAIETELRRSYHYDYARLLGQLAPVCVFRAHRAGETYLLTSVRSGQRAGDIKPLALDRRDGWSQRFEGGFVPQ